jgi:hypothetical protein
LYAYSVGNPLARTDPTGQNAIAIDIGLIGAGGALVCYYLIPDCWQGVSDAVNGLLNPPPSYPDPGTQALDDSAQMSKGGSQNKANEYSRAAVAEAQSSGEDPCDLLDEWYKDAKASGDTGTAMKIVTAQKALGCRNKKKRCK